MADMTDENVDVPTKEMTLKFAEEVAEGDPGILDAQFYDYSEAITSLLFELREGMELTDEVRTEIQDLYDDWEEDGFPQDGAENDFITEGSPEDFTRSMASMEESGIDVDAIPDPEDL